MTFFIKYLYIIPLILVFLPALSIKIGDTFIFVSFIFISLFFLLYSLIFSKKIILDVYSIFKNTPFNYFVYFSVWIIFSGLLLVFIGKYRIENYIYYLFAYLGINMFLFLVFPYLLLKHFISIKTIMRFYIGACLLILLLGILEFIGHCIHSSVINVMIQSIANVRGLRDNNLYYQFDTLRVHSVFQEPGWLGGFLTINLPVFYKLSKSKYVIYQQKFINIFTKKFLIILSWINIILTQSPIWIVFAFIITLNLYYKVIKKNKVVVLTMFTILVISLSIYCQWDDSVNIRESRLYYTIEGLIKRDYYNFALNEPSLASRVTSYYNSFRIFLNNPITGIGLGNSKFYILDYFLTSKLDLTPENIRYLNKAILTGKMSFNGAFLWEFLSETGFVGFIIFYTFLYKLIKQIKNINVYSCIEYEFLFGLRKSLIFFMCISFYDIGAVFTYIWFLVGLNLAVLYKFNTLERGLLCQNQKS